MAESTNTETSNADEVAMALQELSIDAQDNLGDQTDSKHLPDPEVDATLGAPATGADEAKDSESTAPKKPVKGRVFVGGISWRTTDRDLRAYFEEFGAIKDCLVCKDQWTGKSRGFGFLSFEDPAVVETVISKTHTIGGRTVQVKTALPKSSNVHRPEAPTIPAGQKRTKLFVGGLHRSVTNEEFRTYFETYGKLTDAFIMYNMQSKRSRGFGFVTFVSQEAAHQCLRARHSIRGKVVELKVAIPREVIGSPRDKRKMRGGPQHPRQHPRQYGKYDGVWPVDLHSSAGPVPYGHLLPGAPMMTPPLLPTRSEVPALRTMVQQNTPAAGVNPHVEFGAVGAYDQWMPSVMGAGRLPTGMGGVMYSQDVYYGAAMAPPHGMAGNPYGYGYHHMPMYNPYPEAPMTYDPAATMYDTGAGVGFVMAPPSTPTPTTASAAVPARNIVGPPPSTVIPPAYPETPTI